MRRLAWLGLLLIVQWVGFALLEGSDPAGAGGVVLYFLSWLSDAFRHGSPIIAAALAMAAAMRVRGLDVSIIAIAALAAVVMSLFDYGAAFWWTALPAGAVVVAAAVAANAMIGRYVAGPLVLLTLGPLVLWRALAFAIADESSAPPFLMVPRYEALGYATSAAVVLGVLAIVGWLGLRFSGIRPSGRANIATAWVIVVLATLTTAVLQTAWTGEAPPNMMAGYAVHAAAAALLAGAAVGSAGCVVAPVLLAGLNMAVFAEGMYVAEARFGEIGGFDPQQLQFVVLGIVAIIAALAWRRVGRQANASIETVTTNAD